MMKSIIFVIVLTLMFVDSSNQQGWDTSQITGYHFHTYFFQDNGESEREALTLRETIKELSTSFLAGCRLNRVNYAPIGPHIIGSYETCCNASSLIRAQSFFMQNHANLSILLHPLTRYEVLDYTTRAMWLGKDMPLDISALREDLGEGYHDEAKCLLIDLNEAGGVGGGSSTVQKSYAIFSISIFYIFVIHKLF